MFTQKFLQTSDSWSLFLVRVALGVVILVHGLQKVGMIGEGSIGGTMQFLVGIGIPSIIAGLVILGESLGALLLILGVCSRFCAASIGVIMLGAVVLVHWPNGFSMGNGGYEFHILAIAMAGAATMAGGGKWSIDQMIARKM